MRLSIWIWLPNEGHLEAGWSSRESWYTFFRRGRIESTREGRFLEVKGLKGWLIVHRYSHPNLG